MPNATGQKKNSKKPQPRRRRAQAPKPVPLALPARPQRRVRRVRARGAQEVLVRGRDMVAVLPVKKTTRPGDVLATISLNPRAWVGTRIHLQSQAYARWRPQAAKVLIQSTCAATSGGAVALYWTADPIERLPKTGIDNVQRALSYPTSRLFQVWQSGALTIPCSVSQKWLFLEGEEPSDMEHGVVKVVCVAPYTGEGTVSVLLSLEYTYVLEGADMRDQGSGSLEAITARYPDLFTTSVSDFDSGYLVMKYKSGGEAAGFPDAKEGVYYKLAEGSKIQYYDSEEKLQECEFFVVLVDYRNSDGDPVLAPVAAEGNAKAYVKTPNKGYLIKYKSAGPWSEPNIPVFEPVSPEIMLLAPMKGLKLTPPPNCSGPSSQPPPPGWTLV
nr:structural protein [Rhodnius prolixus virus 4]